MKKFITLAIFLLIATPVSAKLLYEYGSFEERAELAVDYGVVQDISQYYGNLDQNLLLLNALEPRLGTAIPSIVAVFETSLASKITSTQTTMTLVSGTTDDSTTLSGMYGFVIDEGSASQEFVLATCADTACTGMTRGISTVTGTSSVTALKKSHRRGASVKITDHPVLLTIVNILTGNGTLPSKLVYDDLSIGAGDSGDTLIDKTYVDNVTNQGAATSSESVAGISELATEIESASSTPWGTNDPHVQQSKDATSTPSSNIADLNNGLWDVWSENDGKINQDWLDLTEDITFTGDLTNTTGTTTMDTASTSRMFIDGVDADNLVGGNNADSLHIHKYTELSTSTPEDITVSGAGFKQPLTATSTIAGGTLGTNNVIRTRVNITINSLANTDTAVFSILFGGSDASTVTITNSSGNTLTNFEGYLIAEIIGGDATNAQDTFLAVNLGTGVLADAAADSTTVSEASGSSITIDSTTDQDLIIMATMSGAGVLIAENAYTEYLTIR